MKKIVKLIGQIKYLLEQRKSQPLERKREVVPKILTEQPKYLPDSRQSQPLEEKGDALSILTSVEETLSVEAGFGALNISVPNVNNNLNGLELSIF